MLREKKTFKERTVESINKEYNLEKGCNLQESGGCCCSCDDHHETHTHCTIVGLSNNWSKHGMCEMFRRKEDYDTSEHERDIIAFVRAAKKPEELLEILKNHGKSRAVVCLVMRHWELTSEHMGIIFNNFKSKNSEVDVLSQLASREVATDEMFEYLSDHASLFVREQVARNENTPERVLEKMCESEKVPAVLYQMIHNDALTPKIAGLVIPLLPKDKEGHNMNQLYIERLNDFIQIGKKQL